MLPVYGGLRAYRVDASLWISRLSRADLMNRRHPAAGRADGTSIERCTPGHTLPIYVEEVQLNAYTNGKQCFGLGP